MNRLLRVFGGLVAGVMLAGLGLLGFMYKIAPFRLQRRHLRVAHPATPEALVGMRIAHLSDFHAGPRVPLRHLQRAKALALEARPDLIALTGDFLDEGQPIDVGDLFTDWPDDVPVLAVLGNHDYRATPDVLDALIRGLQRGGVEVLVNAATQLEWNGAPFWVVGGDDPYSYHLDTEAAFSGVPSDAWVPLYLVHSPVASETMPPGRVGLMLTGHTHGGQVRLTRDGSLPMIELYRKLRKSPAPGPDPQIHRGAHWVRGAVVLISNGIGMAKMPFRFNAPPQVVIVDLVAPTDSDLACDDVRRYVT